MYDKYVCVMFPYPSGSGLHLGHYYNYAIMDSYCRWLRYKGNKVFQPFGYDAFGLPAENYARQVNGDPEEITRNNIQNFQTQIKNMNTLYEEKLITCDVSYTKWTQYIFNLLKDNGLAYKAYGEVNWCEKCGTVLANEQAPDDICERHSIKIEKRSMHQWYFRITNYKERLIKNLEWIDYPESTKKQQMEWLKNQRDWCVSRQRKWGCPIPIDGEEDTLDTFVDSSFYFLRYLTDSPDQLIPSDQYKQVDLYVGGPEHSCMHLIYARFIHMVLYDYGIVPTEEPFKKVIHQGMITRNGNKMSKSKGNAISPDDYDPDELRMYLMFIGPYFEGGEWSDKNIIGIRRFLNRMRIWLENDGNDNIDIHELETTINKYVESFKFNKVISTFMEFMNKNKHKKLNYNSRENILKMLKVFSPGFNIK